MEIINIQSISRQNIPGEFNVEKPEGDAFSQILSQIVGMKEVENVDLGTDLIEWIEPSVDQEQDPEDLLFNPMNIPWIIINKDTAKGEIFGKENMELLIVADDKVDTLLESNPVGDMDVFENINEEKSLVLESDLDTFKETMEMGNKQLLFKESLGDSQPTSGTDKTADIDKIIQLEKPMEKDKGDDIQSEISIEKDLSPKEDIVPLNPKEDGKKMDHDEIDLYKNHIQSIKVEKAYTNESNNEFNTSRNIDFNDNIQNVNDTIVDLMDLRTKGEDHTMKVKLYPEELGYIDVTLKMEEGKLVARILVENEQVRKLFNDHIHQLNNKLVEQEISLERVDVDLNLNTNSQSNSNNNQNSRQNQFPPNRGIILEKTTTITLNEENINGTDGLNILA